MNPAAAWNPASGRRDARPGVLAELPGAEPAGLPRRVRRRQRRRPAGARGAPGPVRPAPGGDRRRLPRAARGHRSGAAAARVRPRWQLADPHRRGVRVPRPRLPAPRRRVRRRGLRARPRRPAGRDRGEGAPLPALDPRARRRTGFDPARMQVSAPRPARTSWRWRWPGAASRPPVRRRRARSAGSTTSSRSAARTSTTPCASTRRRRGATARCGCCPPRAAAGRPGPRRQRDPTGTRCSTTRCSPRCGGAAPTSPTSSTRRATTSTCRTTWRTPARRWARRSWHRSASTRHAVADAVAHGRRGAGRRRPAGRFRERFVVADPDLIYLDGNSLGRLPGRDAGRGAAVVREQWGARPDPRSWHDVDRLARDGSATGSPRTCSARGRARWWSPTRPSVNLYKLAAAALDAAPGRRRGRRRRRRTSPPTGTSLQGLAAAARARAAGDATPTSTPGSRRAGCAARARRATSRWSSLSHVATARARCSTWPRSPPLAARGRRAGAVGPVARRGRRSRVDLAGSGRRPGRRLHVQVPQRRARARPAFLYVRADLQAGCGSRSGAGSGSATSSRWAPDYDPVDGDRALLRRDAAGAGAGRARAGARPRRGGRASTGCGRSRCGSWRARRRARRRVAGAARVPARVAARPAAARRARHAGAPGRVADLPRAAPTPASSATTASPTGCGWGRRRSTPASPTCGTRSSASGTWSPPAATSGSRTTRHG